MSVTLKYTGAISPWRELAVTGKQSAWTPGQQEERSNAEASLLLATGYFEAINLPVARLATDPLTGGVVSILDGKGGSAVKLAFTTAQPYKAAFWGDSRYNGITTTTPDVIGSGIQQGTYRAPMWICGFLGDTDYSKAYGVSGDTASAWQSASRSNGKTFASLNSSDADVVFIQYGVNDAVALTPAAAIAGYLQTLIAEVFKSGKLVVFESIYPVNTPVASFAAVQVIIDATNALMQTWLAQFPTQAIFVDVSTMIKAGGQYASATYLAAADGLHPTRFGAYSIGKLTAAAARALLPKRIAAFYGPSAPASNLCNLGGTFPIATQFNGQGAQGTSSVVQSYGQDANGFYYEWIVTPSALSSGYCENLLQLSANFQTTTPPYAALAGNEILQGGGRVVIDDGAGGAPNIYSFSLRQRFYTGAIFNDTGTATAPNALDTNYSEKVDLQFLTPRMANASASAVANPAATSGYMLQMAVDCAALRPYRVRLYNPQLRRVGYTSAAVSSTVGASPATITNTTNAPQQYIISGGTVSAITLNGTTTGVTGGVFMLDPGDALVITHTGAPTQVLKQMLTQQTLRGLI